MKRKHAELIKAWADGAKIEAKINGFWVMAKIPSWLADTEYRIKPKPSRPFRDVPLNGGYILRFYPSDTGWMCDISNEMMDAIQEIYK